MLWVSPVDMLAMSTITTQQHSATNWQVHPEASPAHRYTKRGPPMLELVHCKHTGRVSCPHTTLSWLVLRVSNAANRRR